MPELFFREVGQQCPTPFGRCRKRRQWQVKANFTNAGRNALGGLAGEKVDDRFGDVADWFSHLRRNAGMGEQVRRGLDERLQCADACARTAHCLLLSRWWTEKTLADWTVAEPLQCAQIGQADFGSPAGVFGWGLKSPPR